jgi:hypothetical protein
LPAELVDLTVNRTPRVDTEVESGYKEMPFKRKRSIEDLNSDAATMVSNKVADAAPSENGRTDSVAKCATSSKRQRFDLHKFINLFLLLGVLIILMMDYQGR